MTRVYVRGAARIDLIDRYAYLAEHASVDVAWSSSTPRLISSSIRIIGGLILLYLAGRYSLDAKIGLP